MKRELRDKAQPDPQKQLSGPFAALHFRDFRLFWMGLLISNVGTWMQMTAVNWLLYDLTHSAFQLGLNGIFRAFPAMTLGILSGTIADRYDRKRILLATQLASGVLAVLFGFLIQTGRVQIWHIYGLTFLSAVVNSLDGPVRQALYPSLVPRSLLPNAVALNSLLWKGTALLGPAIGGIAIATIGIDGAFYINALSFLAVVVALLLMSVPAAGRRDKKSFIADLHEGLVYMLSQRLILGVMVMEAVSSVFGLDHAMLTIFASDILRVGASGFGFLQSARGLGAILGSSFLIYMSQPSYQGKILFFSAILYGASYALFGLSSSFALSLSLLAIVGATDTLWGAARNTLLQLVIPDAMRGRVIGIFNLSNRGLHPLGQVETGLVVPLIGAREATFLGGLLVTAVTLLTARKIPAIPRFQWVGPTSSTGGE